jgi:hypothetical protein
MAGRPRQRIVAYSRIRCNSGNDPNAQESGHLDVVGRLSQLWRGSPPRRRGIVRFRAQTMTSHEGPLFRRLEPSPEVPERCGVGEVPSRARHRPLVALKSTPRNCWRYVP